MVCGTKKQSGGILQLSAAVRHIFYYVNLI